MNTVIICDDNIDFCNAMEALLKKYKDAYEINIVKFYDGDSLLEYCRGNPFDIIYLDIELGSRNGLDVAKQLKDINPKLLTIYISAYTNYYDKMVQAEPFRFVLKGSLDGLELERQISGTLAAAMKRIDPQDIWTFTFRKNEYSVELGKIKYFHSIARTIHIVGNTEGAPDYFYGKLDDIEKEIKEIDEKFVRISKSYIVNKKYARKFRTTQVKVDDKTLSVTQKYRNIFQEQCDWMILI